MLRRVASLVLVASLFVAASASIASAAPKGPVHPAVIAFSVSPRRLAAAGGSVVLTVRVRNAATCRFGGERVLARRCVGGRAAVRELVPPNHSATVHRIRFWAMARGRGGVTPRRFLVVIEAGMRVPPPVTTVPTTTQPSKPSTTCAGDCKFTFPQPTLSGVVSVAVNSVTTGVACPDPGLCDASSSQQIADVSFTACAGSSGDSDIASQVGDLALTLSDGSQAPLDSVTFDNSVPTAFGGYGAVAPNQCLTGDAYFDVSGGATWTSLNYSYTSADFTTQTVYVWTP